MNYKQNHFIIDFINIILRFLLAFAVITILLHRLAPSPISVLCLFPAPFISYFIRRYIEQLWLFLTLHTALLAVYAFTTDNIYVRIVYCLYLIILAIHAFYMRHKSGEQENTSMYFIAVFTLIYLISNYLKLSNITQLNYFLAIVYVLLYFLNKYLLNTNKFFEDHNNLVNVPYHQIKNSNNTLMLFLGSLFFISMILFSKLPLGDILFSLGKLGIRILRAFFSLFYRSNPVEEEIEEIASEAAPAMKQLPSAETSELMMVIATVLQWIVTISVVVALIALMLYALYQLYQYFYRKNETTIKDKTEFISPFDQRVRLKKEAPKRFRTFFGRTNNDVIRKCFYKAVTTSKNSNKELPKDLTPTQLAEYAICEGNGGNGTAASKKKELLTAYYEKARYSNEECSKKDVQIVKDILK